MDKISQSILDKAVPEYVVMRVPTSVCRDADCGYTKQFDWQGSTYQVVELQTIAVKGEGVFIQFTGRLTR